MAKTNIELVEYCRAQLGKPYWYGTSGQIATIPLLIAKQRQYPVQFGTQRFKIAEANHIGKRVHDCIGLIKGFLWSDTSTSAPKYVAIQDVDANQMLKLCKEQGTIDTIPEVPGILVFMTGHVGVYAGQGKVIEARGFDYGVVQTNLKDRNWKNWGKCPWISYEQAKPSGNDKQEEKVVNLSFETLKIGKTGDQVKTIQRLLKSLNYIGNNGKTLVIDGVYGENTEAAVKKYQAAKKLTVDGVIGEKTWASLTGGKIK